MTSCLNSPYLRIAIFDWQTLLRSNVCFLLNPKARSNNGKYGEFILATKQYWYLARVSSVQRSLIAWSEGMLGATGIVPHEVGALCSQALFCNSLRVYLRPCIRGALAHRNVRSNLVRFRARSDMLHCALDSFLRIMRFFC